MRVLVVADVEDKRIYDYYKKEYFLGGYMTGANGFNNRIDEIVDKMQ